MDDVYPMNGLVGREAEQEELAGLLEGPGGEAIVFLGDAGAGKTVLLQQYAQRARSNGLAVLSVTGYESESRYAFAALHQLLLPVLDRIEALDEPHRSRLSLLFGFEVPNAAATDAAPASVFSADESNDRDDLTERYTSGGPTAAVGAAVRALLAGLGRVALIVDDAQWLDRESLQVLGLVCRRLAVGDGDMVVAVRGRTAPAVFGARLREVPLAALDAEQSEFLLDRIVGTARNFTRQAILAQANGNPLALVEFGRAVASGGSAGLGPDLQDPLPLAGRLEAFYAARLRALPPATRRALLIAAAAGTEELVEALGAGLPGVGLAEWEAGRRAGLLAAAAQGSGHAAPDAETVSFVHPLMRSAVYQNAPFAERAEAHRVLAAALGSRPDRRAWHLARSVAHPDEEIAALLEATATQAAERGGAHAGAVAFERAAQLSPDRADAARRMIEAVRLANDAAEYEWLLDLAAQASELTDDLGAAAGLRQFAGRARVFLGRDPDVTSGMTAMIREGGYQPTFQTAFALVTAATGAYTTGDAEQRAQVRAVLAELPDPRGSGADSWESPLDCAALYLYAYYATNPFAPRDEPFAPAAVLDEKLKAGDPGVRLSIAAVAAWLLDQPELTERCVRAARHNDHERQRGSFDTAPFAMMAANYEAWGRWEQATPEVAVALELATMRGESVNMALAHRTAGMLAVKRGQIEQARRHARAALRYSEGISLSAVATTRHLSGLIALTEGDYTGAYTLLRGVLESDERQPLHFYLSHYARADFATAAQATGQQRDAAEVLDRLDQNAEDDTRGTAHYSLRMQLLRDLARALIAGPGKAEGLFLAALAPGTERWPYDHARVRLHYGEWLRRARRISEARPMFTAALDIFRALGAAPWSQRAETELRASGVEPVPEAGHGAAHRNGIKGGESASNEVKGADKGEEAAEPPGERAEPFALLSPQQRAVAELAARGLTNPQIGARLNISAKTVGNHLARVFLQLGVTSRAQLRNFVPDDGPARSD